MAFCRSQPDVDATVIAPGNATLDVTVGRAPLVARIAGGSARTAGLESPLVLDATASSDPDDAKTPLNFSWRCVDVDAAEALKLQRAALGLVLEESERLAEAACAYGDSPSAQTAQALRHEYTRTVRALQAHGILSPRMSPVYLPDEWADLVQQAAERGSPSV